MARTDICKLIDKMQIPWNSEVSVMEIYNTIITVMKEEQKPLRNHAWTLSEDNVLFCDGNPFKRVGPKVFMPHENPEADYWEGRILAKQENMD